ncbi:hypothetical protein WH297_14735 [Ochrobactrum vermis]|uniref:Uncharacterized protein n=1 Tax=Ochrobactrum vermis TaxID=1827297 RepID=A0ABU8PHB0_9HYPH|nr:hypothetical protein [Ochrobactrum vermis]PQZ25405.1 hypothetical protein CQZ93_14975 [Ochrobactrum vermis]
MGKGSNTIRWLAIISTVFCILSVPSDLRAQPAADAEVSAEIEQASHDNAPATDTFGQTQFVLSGDPIIPPRDYVKSLEIPNPDQYDPIESGTIFDIVYMGVVDGSMRFEIRGYTAADLQHPNTGQTVEFPSKQRSIEIRNIRIDVEAVDERSLTYQVNTFSDNTAR